MAETATAESPAFDALEDKQKAFVVAYLRHFNGARAAREAGYGEVRCRQDAYDLVSKGYIRAAIKEQMDRIGITPERIQSAYAEIAFSQDLADMQDVFEGMSLQDLREAGVSTHLIHKFKATRRFVGKGEDAEPVEDVAIEVQDRLKALDALAKVRAMFIERTEVTGAGGGPIETTMRMDRELGDLEGES